MEKEKLDTIHIHAPYIQHRDSKTRLCADIDFKGETKSVWFEVDNEYGQYLCYERSDAFLIGLLNFSMREHCDIQCDTPVTSQLLYQIRTYLLPSLADNSRVLYETRIIADADNTELPCAGGVGTGISCGIDSLHVLKNYTNSAYPELNLTHLVLNNVGSFGDPQLHQYEWHSDLVRRFAKEYGYKLILTNSNIAQAFPQNHFLTTTYTACFAIYALRKLWTTYFYASSGETFQETFSLKDSEDLCSEDYDLLSLDTFSVRNLKIYSEGGAIRRFEKTQALLNYTPAHKYLHVCTSDCGPNCGHCPKCLRTLLTLDVLGSLDKFTAVFDIKDYKRSRAKNLRWLYWDHINPHRDIMLDPVYTKLKTKMPWYKRILWRIENTLNQCYKKMSHIHWMFKIVHPVKDFLRAKSIIK